MAGAGAVGGHGDGAVAAAEAEVAFQARAVGEGRPADVGHRIGQEGGNGAQRRAALEGARLTSVRALPEFAEGVRQYEFLQKGVAPEGGGAGCHNRVRAALDGLGEVQQRQDAADGDARDGQFRSAHGHIERPVAVGDRLGGRVVCPALLKVGRERLGGVHGERDGGVPLLSGRNVAEPAAEDARLRRRRKRDPRAGGVEAVLDEERRVGGHRDRGRLVDSQTVACRGEVPLQLARAGGGRTEEDVRPGAGLGIDPVHVPVVVNRDGVAGALLQLVAHDGVLRRGTCDAALRDLLGEVVLAVGGRGFAVFVGVAGDLQRLGSGVRRRRDDPLLRGTGDGVAARLGGVRAESRVVGVGGGRALYLGPRRRLRRVGDERDPGGVESRNGEARLVVGPAREG